MPKRYAVFYTWENEDDTCQHRELATVTGVALAIIFVIGLVGNICTCLVIIRARAMHTRANFFLLILACSDMLLLFLACPQDFYTLMNGYTVTSDFLCKFWFFGKEAWGFLSALIICSITAERWLAICHPLRMETRRRCFHHALAALSACVLLGANCARLREVSVELLKNNGTNVGGICVVVNLHKYRLLCLITFIFSYLIPVFMLIIMCFQIGAKAASASPRYSFVKGECSRRAPTKTTRLLISVVGSFLVCWSPHRICRTIRSFFLDDINPFAENIILDISAVCYCLNCAVNPILYNMFSEKFRGELLHMIFGRTKWRKTDHH